MRTYEAVFIMNPTLGPEAQATHIDFYKENLATNSGELIKVEPWGKLNLAYKIDKYSDGIYVLMQFKAPVEYVKELDKRFKYNEDIIRHVIVMIDEKKFKLNPKKDVARKDRKVRTEVTDEIGEIESDVQVEDLDSTQEA